MSHYVYILHSPTTDSYYIGQTSNSLEERLRQHNSRHRGFTAKTKDWRIVYFETYQTKQEALKREREIKSWKSRKKIEKLLCSEHPD